MFDFVPPEARSSVEAHIDEVCVSRQLMKNVNQVVMCGGERRSIEWTNRAMADLDGAIIAVHSVGRDIEERLRGEQRLRDSEARYRLLAENSNDVVFQLDRNLVRQYVSPACRDLLGYEPEEMIGNMPTGMAHPDDAPALLATLRTVLRGEQDTYKIIHRMAHRDGRWIWVESNTKAVRDPETNGVIGLIGALRDVSARKLFEEQLAEANQQLSELALVDWLTRLPNRRSFNIAIDREFRRARRERQPLSLLMLDVDWFKAFNDYYGHQAGDECLGSVADLIGSTVQRPGDIAARYGGEEFVIILSNTDQAGAREVASRLQHRLEARAIAHLGSLLGRVTLSIGIATISRDDDDVTLDDLIKRADSALYRAKAEGRNTVCSAP
jgi:diguanylate cyclase (GGDEF)-like protein/PAS domain S-box-containing protein